MKRADAKAAKRAEKHAEQVKQLENATRELLDADGFRRWISARRAFHTYSINNQLMIAGQVPMVNGEPSAEHATRVAGFNTWKQVDRKVVKGAKGLHIFAPMIFKVKDDSGDDTGERKVWFKVVSVFDVSQTDGAALPAPPAPVSIAGHVHAELLDGLGALADELGYTVEYRDLSDIDARGWCSPTEHLIVLPEEETTDEQVKILTHELAHALGVGYAEYGRARAEVIVEAATTVALDSLGFDTSGESLPYIAEWGHREDLASLREDLSKIHELASRLEDAAGVGLERHEREAIAA